jgi:hypothetical protein
MLRKSINLLILIFVLTSCTKIDNYDPPNGGIYGKLTDKITNENLQTEQPNGFTIKLFEKGTSIFSPISLYGKSDGTFENAWIFQNEYKILVTEGAFFSIDTLEVQVGAHTEKNFEVMPFLAVTNVAITPSSGKITATYQITRSQIGDKIIERKTLVSKVPTVKNTVYNFKKETDLTAVDDTVILATAFTDEVTGLTTGTTYFARIAVRTNNKLKRYNYSKVFSITIP